MSFRKLPLLAALAVVVASLLDKPERAALVVGSGEALSAPRTAPQAAPDESLQLPTRRGFAGPTRELFGSLPSPEIVPAPPVIQPAPVAPPVPYRYAGRMRTGNEEEIFLQRGRWMFPVRVGDTIDGIYRVESITAESIEFVYLPLGTKDRVVMNSALGAPISR